VKWRREEEESPFSAWIAERQRRWMCGWWNSLSRVLSLQLRVVLLKNLGFTLTWASESALFLVNMGLNAPQAQT